MLHAAAMLDLLHMLGPPGQKCNYVTMFFLRCIIWMLEIQTEFRIQDDFAFPFEKTTYMRIPDT